MKLAFVVIAQVVLGFFSFVAFYMLWTESNKTGDRVFGFIVHVGMPSAVVTYLARRPTRPPNP